MSYAKRTINRGPEVFADNTMAMGVQFHWDGDTVTATTYSGAKLTVLDAWIAAHDVTWRRALVAALQEVTA